MHPFAGHLAGLLPFPLQPVRSCGRNLATQEHTNERKSELR